MELLIPIAKIPAFVIKEAWLWFFGFLVIAIVYQIVWNYYKKR